MFHAYLQRGTLQELGSLQKRECNSSNCHMRLQWTYPPGIRVLQFEKWQTKVSSPLQVGKPQATWLPFKTLSRGPIVLHPSLHMWRRASIDSCNCKYIFFSETKNWRKWLWKKCKLMIENKKLRCPTNCSSMTKERASYLWKYMFFKLNFHLE